MSILLPQVKKNSLLLFFYITVIFFLHVVLMMKILVKFNVFVQEPSELNY